MTTRNRFFVLLVVFFVFVLMGAPADAQEQTPQPAPTPDITDAYGMPGWACYIVSEKSFINPGYCIAGPSWDLGFWFLPEGGWFKVGYIEGTYKGIYFQFYSPQGDYYTLFILD